MLPECNVAACQDITSVLENFFHLAGNKFVILIVSLKFKQSKPGFARIM
jgi:hypothetical protein